MEGRDEIKDIQRHGNIYKTKPKDLEMSSKLSITGTQPWPEKSSCQ
jgi:hypothetical protein